MKRLFGNNKAVVTPYTEQSHYDEQRLDDGDTGRAAAPMPDLNSRLPPPLPPMPASLRQQQQHQHQQHYQAQHHRSHSRGEADSGDAGTRVKPAIALKAVPAGTRGYPSYGSEANAPTAPAPWQRHERLSSTESGAHSGESYGGRGHQRGASHSSESRFSGSAGKSSSRDYSSSQHHHSRQVSRDAAGWPAQPPTDPFGGLQAVYGHPGMDARGTYAEPRALPPQASRNEYHQDANAGRGHPAPSNARPYPNYTPSGPAGMRYDEQQRGLAVLPSTAANASRYHMAEEQPSSQDTNSFGLQRRDSRAHKASAGMGAMLQRAHDRAKGVGLVRRESFGGGVATPGSIDLQDESYKGIRRQMSLSHGPRGRMGSTQPDGNLNPPAQKAEDHYIDSYDEARISNQQKGEAGRDKVRRMMFGRKRKDEAKLDEEQVVQSSGDEASDSEGAVAAGTRRTQGGRMGESWEHVPSHRSSTQDLAGSTATFGSATQDNNKNSADRKGPHWAPFKGKSKSASERPRGEKSVSDQIASLCATDEEEWEEEQLRSLCVSVSHSEASSKDALQALRKEFKRHDSDDQMSRTVKLWAYIFVHSSDRLKLQVATKRFLETLEDFYKSKHASTRSRGRLLVAWSMIANQSYTDADLQPIVKAFNKIKPADMPVNGTPLNMDHDLFHIDEESARHDQPAVFVVPAQEQDPMSRPKPLAPNSLMTSSTELRASPMQMTASQQSSGGSSIMMSSTGPSQVRDPRDAMHVQLKESRPSRQGTEQQQMQAVQLASTVHKMREECNIARVNAQVLTDSLIEDGLDGPLISEFSQKTRSSQDFITAQIPWASAQADESRKVRAQQQMTHQVPHGEGAANTSEPTDEEALVMDLLDAHEKLATASSMLDDAEHRRREELEEAEALQRSMREMRMDRSTLVRDPQTGHLYDKNDMPAVLSQQGGSGSLLSVPNQREVALTNAYASSSRSPSPVRRPLPDPTSMPSPRPPNVPSQGPSPASQAPKPPPRPLRLAKQAPHDTVGGIDYEDDIATPIQPSEKALGKRRAVSIYETSPEHEAAYINGNGAGTGTGTGSCAGAGSDTEAEKDILRSRPPPALPMR